jgi:glycosyltransferase involved in cell wall biosynthesis
MTRVLHLITSFNRGGIETWLISMLREIPRGKYQMDVCCKGTDIGPLASLAEQAGAKVISCPLGPAHIGFAAKLQRILKEGKYDILHNHLEAYSGFPVWVAHQVKVPVITSFHNSHFEAQTSLTRLPIIRQIRSVYSVISIAYALRNSRLVTGCSQGVINSLDPDGKKLQTRSRVLYYGVNIPDLATSEECAQLRKEFGWEPDTPIILHVGRLIEQKNHLGLLSVFQQILQQVPTAKLLLVGKGPLEQMIEKSINQRGLSHAVRLLGARDDVPSLMSKCDIFLLPSIHEGLGVVVLEANASGLPVIGSRVTGLTEAVRDGETGILKEVGDIEGMAASAIALIKDFSYAQQMKNSGLTWIKDNFSTEVSAKRLLDIYDSLA